MPVIIEQLDLVDTRPPTADEPPATMSRPAASPTQLTLDALRVAEHRLARVHAD